MGIPIKPCPKCGTNEWTPFLPIICKECGCKNPFVKPSTETESRMPNPYPPVPLEIVMVTLKWTEGVSTHSIGTFSKDSLVTINTDKDKKRLVRRLDNALNRGMLKAWTITPVVPAHCLTVVDFLKTHLKKF